MDLVALKATLAAGRMVTTFHANREAKAETLNLTYVRESVILNGDLIEDYPTDPRGPSCLMLSFLTDGRPVHTCWGLHPVLQLVTLITVYRPDLQPHKWSPDWRSRRP